MQTVVGVLRGGPSREHDVSLASGAAILANLSPERYEARDIYIDREGVWHLRGKPVEPERALRQIDVVLNGLHGEFGEDGGVQRLMERYGVPFAGADSFSSFLSMHKVMASQRAREAGLKTPDFRYLDEHSDTESEVQAIVRSFVQPVVVKPIAWGSSVGVSIVGGYAAIRTAVDSLFADGAPGVLVEERVRGKEATVGIVEGLRGEPYYALPPMEIIPPDGDFYSYDSKYDGSTRHVCPGGFSRVEAEELERQARMMHRELGLRHYSRSDFIVSPHGIYYLETNSLPGITGESNMPLALSAVGISLPEFLDHLVNLALRR